MTTRRETRYYLLAEGQDLPEELRQCVEAVRYSEAVVGRPAPTAELKLTVANPGYRWSDADWLQPGVNLDLLISLSGLEADAQHVARLQVVKAPPEFVREGAPRMDVIARDPSDPARAGDVVRSWPRQSDTQRVRRIAQEHGWATRWGSQDTIARGGSTADGDQQAPDFRYLSELAGRYNYDVAMRWDPRAGRWALCWGQPLEDTSQARDLRHNYPDWPVEDQVLEFRPIMASAGRQVTGLQVAGFDHQTKQVVTTKTRLVLNRETYKYEEQQVQSVERQAVGSTIRASVFGEAVRIDAGRVLHSRQQAEALAESWLREHGDQFISGRGVLAGHPEIRAGQVHDLSFYATERQGPRRIGRYSGRYLLTSVEHRLVKGQPYVVGFGARLKARP